VLLLCHTTFLTLVLFFFVYCSLHSLDLLSFPTRRSSDLLNQFLSFSSSSPNCCNNCSKSMDGVFLSFRSSLSCFGSSSFSSSSRSEEHTSELQSRFDLVCRLLLEKKNNNIIRLFHLCHRY